MMKKEKILVFITLQSMAILYVEYAWMNSPGERYLSNVVHTWFGINLSTKSVVPKLLRDVLRSYEHFEKAFRYSRNNQSRIHLKLIVDRLKVGTEILSSKLKTLNETELESIAHKSTTILMNAVNELRYKQIVSQLTIIKNSKLSQCNIVIAYSGSHKHQWITERAACLNIHWLKVNPASSPSQILYQMINESPPTRFLILTRNTVIRNVNESITNMIAPIVKHQADIVGLPVLEEYSNNTWIPGCYQTKVLRYQFKILEGNTGSFDQYALCSYIKGPFAIQRHHLQDILTRRIFFRKEISNYFLLYLDIFYESEITNDEIERKVVFVCNNCSAAIAKREDPYLSDNDVRAFLTKHQLSKLILPNRTTFEYDCPGVRTSCSKYDNFGGKNKMFRPLCCIRELHKLLLKTAHILDKLNADYELDSGTALGATKLMTTLPWERDHDLDIRTSNISTIMKHTDLFLKEGYVLYSENNEHYAGVRSKNWRLEMFGMDALMRDYVSLKDNSNLTYQDTYLPQSRFYINKTLVQMGDSWMPSHPSPGTFSRARLGGDVLKHAWHWVDSGRSSSHSPYSPGSWGECKVKGHHSCSNNYLADGNLQFKSVWV